jgi:2-methylcitrate dehydratase PrpD
MDAEHDPATLGELIADLGTRWEILQTGITVKLYPSCAATHPMLDVLLDLKRRDRFTGADVEAIEIGVDPITPTVLIHDRPDTGLQAKFSMPFCAAAAAVHGRVGIDTFDDSRLNEPAIVEVRKRVTMRIDPALDPSAPPLTQARVCVTLRDGRMLTASANGARGYPDRPASDDELGTKFLSCAARAMSGSQAEQALTALRGLDRVRDVRTVTAALARDRVSTP